MDMGWWQVLMGISGCIATAVVTIVKVTWVVKEHLDNIKADYEERFSEMEKEQDGKHNRIYERLDEYKVHVEKDMLAEFVRKDLWEMRNSSLETIVRELANRQILIEKKIDDLRDLILKGNRDDRQA